MVVDGLKRQPLVTKGLQGLLNAIMGMGQAGNLSILATAATRRAR